MNRIGTALLFMNRTGTALLFMNHAEQLRFY